MSMPTSGTISMGQINTELDRSATELLLLSDDVADLLRGLSSNPISLSQFYSKTNFVMTAGGDSGIQGYSPTFSIGTLSPTSDTRYSTILQMMTVTGPPGYFSLEISGSHPQNYFTTLDYRRRSDAQLTTLSSSGASTYQDFGSKTRWEWNSGFNAFTVSSVYHCFLNP